MKFRQQMREFHGVERKRVDAPKAKPSMHITRVDLQLAQVAGRYPGPRRYAMGDGLAAVPLDAIPEGMKGLFGTRD